MYYFPYFTSICHYLPDLIHIVQLLRRASHAVVQNLLRQNQSQRMRSRARDGGPCWSWSASEVSFIFWDVALRKDTRKNEFPGVFEAWKAFFFSLPIFQFFLVLFFSILFLFLFYLLSLGSLPVNVSLIQSCRCINLAKEQRLWGMDIRTWCFLEKLVIGHFTVCQNHHLRGI